MSELVLVRDELHEVELSVHDAVAANVDLMPGPPRIIERAIASAELAERRRARALAAGLTAAAVVAGAVGVAVASGWRPPT